MGRFHEMVLHACKTGDLSEISKHKIDAAMILSKDENGNIPIMLAAAHGNITVIKLLDDLGDKLLGYDAYKMFSVRNLQGYNALSLAAKNGYVQAVITLYELGAYDSYTANQFDWQIYAKMQVKPSEDSDNVAKNLKNDAQTRLKEIYAKALFDEVTYTHAQSENIRKAIKLVGDVNAIIYDEHTALYHAIRYRNVTSVKVLLEEGAYVEPDMIPLALDSKEEEIISLIGQNVPLSAQALEWGNLFDVLLDHAVRKDDAKVVARLLPHMTISKLQEALLYSAEIDSPEVLTYLLKNGVDVNCVENHLRARSPAMLAAKNGHADILAILIAHGANLNQRSERGPIRGITALDYAKIKRRKKCIKLILEAVALTKYGDTPLTHAAACGSVSDLLSKLPANEAQGQVPDITSLKNAIHAAKEAKQPRIIVRQLQRYMRTHYSRFRLANLKRIFARK